MTLPRWMRLWGGLAGAAVVAGAYPLYLLGIRAASQLAAERTGALFLTLDGLLWGATAPVAAWLAARPASSIGPWWTRALWLAFAANMGLIGARVFAPTLEAWRLPSVAVSAAIALAVALPFWRHPAVLQARLSWGLIRAGLIAALVPVVTLPWVLAGWAADRPASPPGEIPAVSVQKTAPDFIVLVTFDAFSAGAWSLGRGTKPASSPLTHLASTAYRFPGFRAASDRTVISLPSLLTGKAPPEIYARPGNKLNALREGVIQGLPGILRHAAYATWSHTSWVSPTALGLRPEFDTITHSKPFADLPLNVAAFNPALDVLTCLIPAIDRAIRPTLSPHRDAIQATRADFDTALTAICRHQGRMFMWLHIPAPHSPLFRVHPRPGEHALVPGLDYDPDPLPEPAKESKASRQPGLATYRGYAAFAEAELARFVEGLRARGLWDRTMLVVTSDHGEDYTDEAPLSGHANGLATEWVTSVPLLIHVPGQTRPVIKPGPCGHLDLVPTILAQVFEQPPAALPGLVLTGPEPLPDRPVYCWAMGGKLDGGTPHQQVAAYDARWKLVKTVAPQPGLALYDLQADPEARQDVAARHPEVVKALHARLLKECPP